ncbi:hypothetical protein C0991_007371 [Blastosporella zonata]|nr:hypothetical protein C0991_007371 [Blastosporella zonata]
MPLAWSLLQSHSSRAEDAPAPSALHTFKAHVADGKIYVTADATNTLSKYKARQPKLLSSGTEASGNGVVIVGGGSAAFQTVESLREHGYKAPITILSKETYTPIDRTKLSKALITDPAKVELKSAGEFKIKYGTTIRLGVEVTAIDLNKKEVTIDGGKDTLSYDKIVLATGGTPRRLPVEGAQLENVYTFRGIADAQKVDAAAKEGKRLVVIGSSFISMEIVVAVSKKKLASIDVIGMESRPFEAILGKEVGAGLQKYHESQGVKFHMQSKVDKIIPREDDPNLAGGVVVNGATIPADFVVMGVGVAPATEFVKGSGIELERDGGIKVDKYLRVQSGPDQENVYAVGDIALFPQVTGNYFRIEHWNVAGNHGRCVGKTISGSPQEFVKVPVFWSAQGQQLRYCGIGHGYDDVFISGDPGEMKFIAYYGKEGKIVAVSSMQNDPVVSKASELLRLSLMPSLEEVKAGKVPWKGKAKATDEDFEDLNPTITYRHLHAQNIGVRDPLRIIALCDSDAFYAGCEMVRLGIDKDTPLVVLQWDALIAINYPARKFGITRLKKYNLRELQEKHPELKIVHVATYKEGEKEPGYWDDVDTKTHKAFFDFSKRVREIILERYPYLALVPPDAPHGVDTPLPPPPPFSWNDFQHAIAIPINPAPEVDQHDGVAPSCAAARGEEAATTWHDIALSIGAELMGEARRQVHEQLGYSTSAGIARNKFLAKVNLYHSFDIGQLNPDIRFLGGKLGTAIAKEFEVATVGDLLCITLEEMQCKFGEESIWIYEVLRGVDRSEVKEKSTLNKSMLASKNLPQPITNASEGFQWIRVLAAELALRLNEAREISPNLWPKSIVLRARRGYNAGHSKQAPFPFTPEVTVDTVATAANALWKELVGTDPAMKVTSVSLAFSGIEGAEVGQRSIEGFFKTEQPAKRRRDYDSDDNIRWVSVDGYVAEEDDNDAVKAQAGGQSPDPHIFSFNCSRCGKKFSIPSSAASPYDGEEQLTALRLEHDDYHFAQDLAKEPDGGPIISGPSTSAKKPVLKPLSKGSPKKKKRRKAETTRGIEQFFRRS